MVGVYIIKKGQFFFFFSVCIFSFGFSITD